VYKETVSQNLQEILDIKLVDAIFGRRSRRFAMGAAVKNGPLQFTSRQEPLPLSDTEKLLVLAAVSGNTGWHYAIMHNPKYAPFFPNYAGAAGGRTFPSSAGFETSQVFFTDDTGTYFVDTRDAPARVERNEDGFVDIQAVLEAHRSCIRKISDHRLNIPREEPFIEGHNLWIANIEGSMLVIPVGDLAQHMLLNLCYYLQNGYVIYDDTTDQKIPGIERFSHLADVDNPIPLTFIEMWSLGELTVELAAACYAGSLMLQAVGLGGWMFNGLNPFAILGASGDDRMSGLGFRYDEDDRWPLPNPTGLAGVMEGFCPPYYPDMRSAVEAVAERKFGLGGPFNPETSGMWITSGIVRGSAMIHSEEFKECVALQAQYIYDQFGKFPGTVPSIYVQTYLQAHHLDLEFYDRYFNPGACLKTHREHLAKWHKGNQTIKREKFNI